MQEVLLWVSLIIGILAIVASVLVLQSLKGLNRRLLNLDKKIEKLNSEVDRTENQVKALQSEIRAKANIADHPLIPILGSFLGGGKGGAIPTAALIGYKLFSGFLSARKAVKALPATTQDSLEVKTYGSKRR